MNGFLAIMEAQGIVTRVKACPETGTITGRFESRNPAETNPPRKGRYRSYIFPDNESITEGYCIVYNRDGSHRIGRLTKEYEQSKEWARQGRLTDKPIYRLKIKNVRKPLDCDKASH